ncbi:MAG: hypothetical protein U1F76_23175 [Candidatus Competibacteraceae bacterium]
MNTLNSAKSTACSGRFNQLMSSTSLWVGAILAFVITMLPVAVQARDDNDNDRDDNPAYGYHRHYDPDARYPDGTYPHGDWDRYRGGYSSNYDSDNPNSRYDEAPDAHRHHDRHHDGDNDNDQDDNNNNHSHHHHDGLFHNLF